MKLRIHNLASDEDNPLSRSRSSSKTGSARVQFGNEIVEVTNDSITNATRSSASRKPNNENSDIREQQYDDYDSSWVHLVMQKGRLFNMEYPAVPVLYDRGRFQLVAIDPDEARKLYDTDVCFRIQPLEDRSIVFEQPPAAGRLAQINVSEKQLVDSVDKQRFMETLEELVSFRNRHTLSDDFTDVTNSLMGQLDTLGYDTRIEPIDIFDRTGQFAGRSSNLIAVKPAQDPSEAKLILVTAHLDSVNLQNQFDETLDAPGADDNGSGSAGVMEIARVFSQFASRHELQLVLFGGEEQNLFGSRQFVESLSVQDRQRLAAVINMDMIGVRNADPPTVLIEGAPVSRHVMDQLALRAAAYTDLVVRRSENPFASDHVPFIDEGLPAVLTIEGDDSQNNAIHTPGDIIDLISPDYAEQILKMNVGYIASLMLEAV